MQIRQFLQLLIAKLLLHHSLLLIDQALEALHLALEVLNPLILLSTQRCQQLQLLVGLG